MEKNSICRGREQEKNELLRYIGEHDHEKSCVINLYGRGGIGKTVLTKEIYRNFKLHMENQNGSRKSVYINASGCFDVPELLFRLRMEMNGDEFDFEKFDTLYELFYDASRFIKYERARHLLNRVALDYDMEGEYAISIQMGDDSNKLSELLLEPLIKSLGTKLYEKNREGLAGYLLQTAEIAGPIVDRISIASLISRIASGVREQNKKKRYIEILNEIQQAQGLFQREEKLVDFFYEALTSSGNSTEKICFYFFIDNFQNPHSENMYNNFAFQNVDMFFQMARELPALWFISSRNQLLKGRASYCYKLEGLGHGASVEIIKNVDGVKQLNNKDAVINSILSVAKTGTEVSEDSRYSPIILKILCEVLKKEIASVQERAPGETKYNVSAELFAEMNNKSALAYYFEMGKSTVDLDCFHILACADIWDEYTLSILRNKLQLYLLNTKHILSQDSMIEIVDNHLIKLHDEIAEALRESASNRIRYDVYAIMYDAFLEIQDSVPVLEESVLRNFFEFAKAYCQNIASGVYPYIDVDALYKYDNYYKAFLKSIDRLKERVSEPLLDIYWAVVKEYRRLAQQCNADDYSYICNAYHKLGVIAYDIGDSKKAEVIDKEYLEFVEQVKDVYGLSSALNALAYDLSANHLYSISYEHGKRSLEVALNGIRSVSQDEIARELSKFYDEYLTLPEDENYNNRCLKDIENTIEKHQTLLKDISTIPDGADNYIIKKLWEQMLKTRGNIPWYFMENHDIRDESARYALYYGKVTYLLRKTYYGEKVPATVQSYHNIGVYLIKYIEYCMKGDIYDPELSMEEAFSSAIDVFSESFSIRKEFGSEREKTEKKRYEQELKNTKKNNTISFLDIYNSEDINQCYESELSSCNDSALESLQYMSYAYYLEALAQQDESKRRDFLEKAIQNSNKVIVARSIVLGPLHRKTLESMRYGAEYYWKHGEVEEAKKRILYAVNNMNEQQVPSDQIDEYRNLLDEIQRC